MEIFFLTSVPVCIMYNSILIQFYKLMWHSDINNKAIFTTDISGFMKKVYLLIGEFIYLWVFLIMRERKNHDLWVVVLKGISRLKLVFCLIWIEFYR